MYRKLTPLAALLATARAQQACSLTTETHPSMTWKRCAAGGSCTTVNGQVTIDANWRWLHSTSGSTNCYTGNKWNDAICSTNLDCAEKCCVDGASYASTYGVTTSGDALNLKFVTKGSNTNVGSRLYLMASENQYQMFNLLGNEFTFDVDVSNLPCGLNGALYFVSMDADGGASKFPSNKAGAKYGTGYCDSQCPRDLKFINGQANIEGWTGSTTESGVGSKGACCAEMDIWEANSISTAYTPHPCSVNEYHSCNGDDCGGTYSSTRYAGDCDPDGCDFNSYRQGDKSFYGAGLTVDTTKKITVVTQFLTGSDGTLSEIKRFYVQGGKVIPNSQSTIPGVTGNSITKNFCDAQKKVFNDTDIFSRRGGLAQMGEALKSMVLVMSLWDDYNSNMLWLDSTFPVDSKNLGAERGTCPTTSGKPADVEANSPNSNVIYSNIKFGPIGSTFSGSTDNGSSSTTRGGQQSTSTRGGQQSTSTRAASSTRTSSAPSTNPTGGVSQRWEQCGGNLWKGPTTCVAGTTCVRSNEWYSQCL